MMVDVDVDDDAWCDIDVDGKPVFVRCFPWFLGKGLRWRAWPLHYSAGPT